MKYNKKFKNQDRFQNPLTRGKFLEESEESESHMRSSNQDGHIKKIVGVIASVVYLVETTPPEFGEGPGENLMARETYLYDLEIAESEKGEVVTGGEWHQNNHPDFLFVPKKNTTVRSYWDLPSFVFNSTSSETDEGSLSLARSASTHGGYPLNAVVEALVKSSTLPRSRNK